MKKKIYPLRKGFATIVFFTDSDLYYLVLCHMRFADHGPYLNCFESMSGLTTGATAITNL